MAKEKDEDQRLKIKVFSPYQTFFEGQAISISATNKAGPFDVLAKHGEFFTLLLPGSVMVDTGFEHVEIEIENGIMKVSENSVTLFANV